MIDEKKELKTIKELATELGVSKQTIQYHIKFLPTKNRQKNDNGIIVINLLEQDFIRERVGQKTDKKQTKENIFLYEQIEDLKEQNHDLRKLLNQQQQLQLKTQQMLEEKTLLLETVQKNKWWKFWKN
mgnify:FL=1